MCYVPLSFLLLHDVLCAALCDKKQLTCTQGYLSRDTAHDTAHDTVPEQAYAVFHIYPHTRFVVCLSRDSRRANSLFLGK